MLMDETSATDEGGVSCEAALAAQDFLRRHGAGLCDLLGVLADETAFDALCDLHAVSGAALPDARIVRRALRTIHAALAAQQLSVTDTLSVRKGYCVDTCVRWYGARISDLLAAFQ